MMDMKHRLSQSGVRSWRKSMTRAQSGQALIFIAVAMIALLGMLGMSIDGGRLFFLRRDTQNATDAAVVAATYSLCTGADSTTVENSGRIAAQDNDFVDNGDTILVTVNNPPLILQEAEAPYPMDSLVEVEIVAQIDPYFIQLVYGGDLEVTSYALGHCVPGWDPYTQGRAVVGLSDTCVDACSFTGSSLYLDGGVTCNTNLVSQGSGHEIDGPVNVMTDNPTDHNNLVMDSGYPDIMDEPVVVPPLYDLDDYDLTKNGAQAIRANNLGDYHYSAGDLTLNHPGSLEGLYFVDGYVSVIGNVTSGPSGVSIVATGQISFSGNRNSLFAYDYGAATDDDRGDLDWLLLFSIYGGQACAGGAGNAAISTQSSDSSWRGVVYAPNGLVKWPGSSAYAEGAIVAWEVNVPGSHTAIYYQPEYLPPVPPSITIEQ